MWRQKPLCVAAAAAAAALAFPAAHARLELEVCGVAWIGRLGVWLARRSVPPSSSEGKNNDNDGLTKRLKCTLASGRKRGRGGAMCERGSVQTGLVKKEEAGSETG